MIAVARLDELVKAPGTMDPAVELMFGAAELGLEMVFKKTSAEPFNIPVDNIGSVDVSDVAWRGDPSVKIAPIMPVDPAALLSRLPLRVVHAVYWSRLLGLLRGRASAYRR